MTGPLLGLERKFFDDIVSDTTVHLGFNSPGRATPEFGALPCLMGTGKVFSGLIDPVFLGCIDPEALVLFDCRDPGLRFGVPKLLFSFSRVESEAPAREGLQLLALLALEWPELLDCIWAKWLALLACFWLKPEEALCRSGAELLALLECNGFEDSVLSCLVEALSAFPVDVGLLIFFWVCFEDNAEWLPFDPGFNPLLGTWELFPDLAETFTAVFPDVLEVGQPLPNLDFSCVGAL